MIIFPPFFWGGDLSYLLRQQPHPSDVRALEGGHDHTYQFVMGDGGGQDVIIVCAPGTLHAAYVHAQRVEDQAAVLAVQNLHTVAVRVHEHEHVTVVDIHAQPVVHYAAQAEEAHAHAYGTAVEPEPHRAVKAEHGRRSL